jgi:murein DD-endopeptidase MepM/ murein hydrolase activator NlpD|tara:strand:+ start:1415 stop:2335 length:921 start_codon:yes stop_codon:yes gene_type:complete
MISNRKYILHSESDNLVNQWHFSNAKILALVSVTLIILGSFLLIGADYVSKVLYDKRLKEFKANYSSVVSNIDKIQSRLKELDQQILDIEEKDKAVRTYAGMPQVDKDIRKLGIGGVRLKKPNVLDNLAPAVSKEISQLHLDIEKLSRQVNFELVSYEKIYDRVKGDIDRIRHIPSIRPVSGGFLNSSFGYRQDPIDDIRRFHQGQDITVPTGTPIFSPADGVVKRAYYIGGFGNHIKLKHTSGYSTTYAHLSKIFVRHGQKIKRGDIIGETGNTGRSTAPHLHYEVHYRGTPKNPLDYFFTQAGN